MRVKGNDLCAVCNCRVCSKAGECEILRFYIFSEAGECKPPLICDRREIRDVDPSGKISYRV